MEQRVRVKTMWAPTGGNDSILVLARQLAEQRMRALAAAQGALTRTQVSIMTTQQTVGPLAMTPLAECIGVSQEQASHAIKPLIERELVQRQHHERNRRVVTVRLTGGARRS